MPEPLSNAAHRRKILENRPEREFPGEPQLGAWYTEEEIQAAEKAIRASMDYRVGFGFIVEEITQFEEEFAAHSGAAHAVSLSTASVGLDLAMRQLALQPGDEVITPSLNFKASALAILGAGGKPIFCEVDPCTFNMDPADVERRVSPRTRAIFPVHMNGLSAPMDDLIEIGQRHPHAEHGPLPVIGDAARACGGGYKGTRIGKKGWMTVFSFHTMKLMSTLGEGGMVTTDDPELAERLRGMRQWGSASNTWGSSYKLTKVQAAVGSVQLRRLDEMLALRVLRAHERKAMLEGIPKLTLPYEPPECDHTFYLFTLLVPTDWAGDRRDRLVQLLRDEYNVGATVANAPVWEGHSFVAAHTADQAAGLPVSTEIGNRLFCVSLHPLLTPEENTYISAAIWEAVERIRNS